MTCLPPKPRPSTDIYDPHLDARESYFDAIEAIRRRKIASGEIKEETNEAGRAI